MSNEDIEKIINKGKLEGLSNYLISLNAIKANPKYKRLKFDDEILRVESEILKLK